MSTAEASPWVARFAPLIAPGGAVLDLACGGGRHTRFFAGRGHPVVAVDRDTSGLGVPPPTGVEAIEADLEDSCPWVLTGRRFAGVVVTRYLHRPILGALVDAVAPGGVLIYETFAAGQERYGRPTCPDFLLEPGELLDAVRGQLRVVAYEDLTVEEPTPAVIQRICARRESRLLTEELVADEDGDPLPVGLPGQELLGLPGQQGVGETLEGLPDKNHETLTSIPELRDGGADAHVRNVF